MGQWFDRRNDESIERPRVEGLPLAVPRTSLTHPTIWNYIVWPNRSMVDLMLLMLLLLSKEMIALAVVETGESDKALA